MRLWRGGPSISNSKFDHRGAKQFCQFWEAICQSGFEGVPFDHDNGRNALIASLFREQKRQLLVNRAQSEAFPACSSTISP
jgi:hypothetical protein